jgi:hypothetical protein
MISATYPQGWPVFESCSLGPDSTNAWLPTAFNSVQVLDQKGENAAIHRNAGPLSTATNLS